MIKKILAALICSSLLLITVNFLYTINKKIDIQNNESLLILVNKDYSVRKFIKELRKQNFIGHDFFNSYLIYAKLALKNGKLLKYGEYEVIKGDSYYNLISKIKNSELNYRKLTLIEGETVANYKKIIDNSEGLFGQITEPMSDGYIMPDTYFYTYGDKKDDIIKKAKSSMSNFLSNALKVRVNNILTESEVVILASIIQREAANNEEMPIVASVFYNRMLKKMRLQSDPTVLYYITNGTYTMDRYITFQDLLVDTPYNTYKVVGLPPSPISNPSRYAINAVLNPATTEFLYFVLGKDGKHIFSKTFEEHLKNANEYRKNKPELKKVNA